MHLADFAFTIMNNILQKKSTTVHCTDIYPTADCLPVLPVLPAQRAPLQPSCALNARQSLGTELHGALQVVSVGKTRIPAIDVAKGVALVAMAIYHFVWDLEFFGWVAPFTIQQSGWVIFARSIAASFLFLVGINMVLTYTRGIVWPAF
jgi:hypothetical protein